MEIFFKTQNSYFSASLTFYEITFDVPHMHMKAISAIGDSPTTKQRQKLIIRFLLFAREQPFLRRKSRAYYSLYVNFLKNNLKVSRCLTKLSERIE